MEDYLRFKHIILTVLEDQWTPMGSADQKFIQKYFNEVVVPNIPKGEPLLKCTTCSSAWWNAIKTSRNYITHKDKKEQDELSKQRTDTGGDNNNEVTPVKPVNKKSSKKSV